MDDAFSGISPLEQEWRSCLTAIRAAAEILRDNRGLHEVDRDQFISAIIDESERLRRTFEQASDTCVLLSPPPSQAAFIPL
jgi:signal transduction histidine kinase